MTKDDKDEIFFAGIMLDRCKMVQELIAAYSFEEFISDRMLVSSVSYDVMVIGQAFKDGLKHDPKLGEKINPEIPWDKLKGIRNRLSHEYYQIDARTLYEAGMTSMPKLQKSLESYLKNHA